MHTDERIDEYISKSANFAKPILTNLRNVVHKACPQVKETMKWSFPHFEYAGRNLCSMASFKQHCAFTFWLGSVMKDEDKLLSTGSDKTAMGHFGQIKSLNDLPPDNILEQYIKEAMVLNEKGIKAPKKGKATLTELEVPEFFMTALKKTRNALSNFKKFSPSQKKEYVEWLTEAKTEDTKNRRLQMAIEWIEEGKDRHWKYKKS